MAVPFLVFDWLTTSKYQKVGQLFYTDFFSNFTVLTHLRQTTPRPPLPKIWNEFDLDGKFFSSEFLGRGGAKFQKGVSDSCGTTTLDPEVILEWLLNALLARIDCRPIRVVRISLTKSNDHPGQRPGLTLTKFSTPPKIKEQGWFARMPNE
jgi:hypothetical protein